MNDLAPILAIQAIWINFKTLEWDALSKISTVDFIRQATILGQDSTAKLLILSNFTGFLENSGKWTKAKPQFDDIFLHSRDVLSTAIWIEPQRNNVTSFFGRAVKLLKKSFGSLIGAKSNDEDGSWYAQAEITCKQTIKEGDFPVRLTVMRFDLPLESKK